MSSRGQFIGSGADAGIYQPRPVPAESDQLATYINDELLQLGGRFNEVLEGGAFPPSSEMPQRWKDGQMVYFTKALDDTYPNGPYKGQKIVPSPGVYLYKDGREVGDPEPEDGSVEGRWWKIIDDPSSIQTQRFVYQFGNETTPETPPRGPGNPPTGWELSPPKKDNKGQYIWASEQLSVTEDLIYEWGDPIIWSGGVADGGEGVGTEQRFIAWPEGPAPTFSNPNDRYPRTPGGELYTLTIPPVDPPDSVYVYVTSGRIGAETDLLKSPWSNPVPYSTPDTTTIHRVWATGEEWGDPYPSFDPNGNPTPGNGWTDSVPPLSNDYPQWVSDRLEWRGNGAPQTVWTTPTYWNAQKGDKGDVGLPGGTGTAWITINGTQWGDLTATNTIVNTFGRDPIVWDVVTVKDVNSDYSEAKRWDGSAWIYDPNIIDGSLVVDGTIIGSAIKASTQIRIGGADAGGNPNYMVVLDGNPSEPYLMFAGHPDGSLANFTIDKNGNMNAKNAIFNGNITTGSTITGGTINGGQITSSNGNFTVDTAGNMTCQNATINGDLIGDIGNGGNARLIGSEVHVPTQIAKPTGNFTGFHVYSDGSTYIGSDAIIQGSVYAERIVGDITSAVLKSNDAFKQGYLAAGVWRTMREIVTVEHNRPYDRHLKIGVTERPQGFCISCDSQGYGDQFFYARLINIDTGYVAWEKSFNVNLQRFFTVDILTIITSVPSNTGAGTYELQVKCNRNIDGIQYMYDAYSADTSGAVQTLLEAVLFKDSGELS
ncbi:tail fiber protein [Vibrio phage Vp_R1]|uniref:Straight fiber protein PB4 spike domain-containing protein n=1 Tax=Vibrio phage Vp_R1 TaxID=2059867 RepID=A0A2H5BQ73_9CAUD|nr:tail fiber protein [Vibrio phage Vp_R1]AUG88489.1 hypothetical protein VPR_125 [Vibrio phage Vp_R1]